MPSDAVVEGVSGAIGGCVATIATFPLMTITTRQQITRTTAATAPSAAAKEQTKTGDIEEAPPPPPSPSPRPLGTLGELLRTVRTSGWSSLFNGLSASLVGTTVSQGVYFYLYSLLRQAAVRKRTATAFTALADSRSAQISVAESLLVAALAGMGNVLLTNPIWMIATRMQAHNKQRTHSTTTPSTSAPSSAELELPAPGPIALTREVYSEYGLSGFWNGVGASLVMVINPTIQYAFYEWLVAARAQVKRQKGGNVNQRPSAGEVFMLSAIAKAGATVLTYPLLTVKTRMMSARKSDAEMQYSSVVDAIRQIAQREGLGGYYKGIRTKILQSVLAAALLFMCKEKITDVTRDFLSGRQRKEVLLAAVVLTK